MSAHALTVAVMRTVVAHTPDVAHTSPAHLHICWHLGAAVLKGHSGLLTLQAGKL